MCAFLLHLSEAESIMIGMRVEVCVVCIAFAAPALFFIDCTCGIKH